MRIVPLLIVATAASLHAGTPASSKAVVSPPPAAAASWKEHTISPVADPIYFEDPIVRSEIKPVFMYHRTDDDFITGRGESNIYGIRLQYAVNDRLGLFINKGGYMDVHPGIGESQQGWANAGLGFKYMLIDNDPEQFVLTAGLGYELPIGDKDLFWNNGDGEFNIFTTTEKGWGDFHVMATLGLRAPTDTDANSTSLHYGVQADYFVSRWFIPFVQGVGYTVLDAGKAFPSANEGLDAQNFGSVNSDGSTEILLGVGFRSRLTDSIDIGVAYQKGVGQDHSIFDDRFTFDVQFRF